MGNWVEAANRVMERHNIPAIPTVEVYPTAFERLFNVYIEGVFVGHVQRNGYRWNAWVPLTDQEGDELVGQASSRQAAVDLVAASRTSSVGLCDVIEHHEGHIYRVTDAPVPEHITLHVSFRNVAAKQHFSYAMATAWPQVTVINRQGEARLSLVTPLGV